MVSFSSAPFLCVLLIFALILLQVHGDDEDPLFHYCDHSNSSSAPGSSKAYQSNLATLAKNLTAKVSKTGFAKASEGNKKDTVYGLALCRGDVSSSDCEKCVEKASEEIQNRCPRNSSMIIWYDSCEVKFSPENFFGKIDNNNTIFLLNVLNLTADPSFVNVTSGFLLDVSKNATSSPKLYAAQIKALECQYLTLYGLAQCTLDLSKDDCSSCLKSAVSSLSTRFPQRQGARKLLGSCNVRYEIYPFFQS